MDNIKCPACGKDINYHADYELKICLAFMIDQNALNERCYIQEKKKVINLLYGRKIIIEENNKIRKEIQRNNLLHDNYLLVEENRLLKEELANNILNELIGKDILMTYLHNKKNQG